MAFFGLINYSKPGPGVSKDEPEKTAFFRFFGIFFSKFWDLVKVNMLYFVCIILFCIPAILFIINMGYGDNLAKNIRNAYAYLMLFVCLIPVALTGPFTAGFTYLMRNFVRHEHSFLFSDFKDHAVRNIRQSITATLINVFVFCVLFFNFEFYLSTSSSNKLLLVPLALCEIAAAIFLFMNYYVYILIVTFDLKLKQIYKNAFIFSVLGIGRNILVTVFLALVVAIPIFFPLALILVPFLTLSFIGLLINFSSWPMIRKHMIDPVQEQPEEELSEDDTVFKDTGRN